MLQNEDTSVLIKQYQLMSVFSNLPWLLFRMIDALLNTQLLSSKREFIAFLIISFSLMQSADYMICSRSSSWLWFLPVGCVFICPRHKYLRSMRSGEFAGQAYGQKWVWDTKEQCLPEMGVSMKVVHKTRRYCTLCCDIKVLLVMWCLIIGHMYSICTQNVSCDESRSLHALCRITYLCF